MKQTPAIKTELDIIIFICPSLFVLFTWLEEKVEAAKGRISAQLFVDIGKLQNTFTSPVRHNIGAAAVGQQLVL